MNAPKGFAGVRTVTIPRVVWYYWSVLAFAGLVALSAVAGLGVYLTVLAVNRPDVPLLAPDVVPVKAK